MCIRDRVGPEAPFSDDFSTATRLRSFDASLSVESGDPVVSVSYTHLTLPTSDLV